MNITSVNSVVYSDLDGSLLDHYDYSYEAALPALKTLERQGIPLVLASSKTRAELLELRRELANGHPFIVENGAAIFVPREYFPVQPVATVEREDYWVYEMAPARTRWLTLLATLEEEFPAEFSSFWRAGITGIEQMTGLSQAQAARANDREYSEPVKWLGSPQQEFRFIQRLQEAGATVARGGRFLTVSGSCDKGQALIWLRNRYLEASSFDTLNDLAIGDSENDRPMLEAAGTALLVPSPVHDFPSLAKTNLVIHGHEPGPVGWAEGVTKWLALQNITT